MFSLISLKPSLGQKFQENAGKIAAVSIAATLIAIFLIYNFIDRGPGTFLPPSPIAGYIILSMTPLFIFDALRYSLLHHKNGLILRPKPHKTVKGNSATIFSSKDSGNSSTAKDASPLVLTPDSLRAAKQEVYERMILNSNPTFDTIKQLSQGLPEKNITIYHYELLPSGACFYGQIQETEEYVPISINDGIILEWQERHKERAWILRNPQNNTYFVPRIIKIAQYAPRQDPVKSLKDLISLFVAHAEESPTSIQYSILKVLFPYARDIQDADQELYRRIHQLMPTIYPENPVRMVWT